MTIAKLRGEGGVVWEFELPLNEVFANQVKARKLVPADDRSYDLVKDLLAEDTDDVVAEPVEPPSEPTLAERIAAAASHAEANALAAELGVDGFEEKSPKLDDKRAALTAKADELAANGQ